MTTHNLLFCGEIRKISILLYWKKKFLSRAMKKFWYFSYFSKKTSVGHSFELYHFLTEIIRALVKEEYLMIILG